MKFTMVKIAALAAMVFASTGTHAVLNSNVSMSIENDAVATYGYNPVNSTTEWYVSSNGPLVDSFFTMGGSKNKLTLDTQYAYLTGVASPTYYPYLYDESWGVYVSQVFNLNGAPQPTIATFTYFGAAGSIKTTGTGISILSASGDTATVDMSGLAWAWHTDPDISLGSGAWSTGYTDGVGNITCSAGSSCSLGSEYTLKYTATFPVDGHNRWQNVPFYLELHGTVGFVPEASTYGMMLAGLGLVGVAVCRHRACSAV